MRVVSSQTLRLLAAADTAYFVGKVLPALLDASLSPDLPTRHGSALGVAEVVLGLSEAGCSLPEDLVDKAIGLVPAIEKARLYRYGSCCAVALL
jgi:hypothetical protein